MVQVKALGERHHLFLASSNAIQIVLFHHGWRRVCLPYFSSNKKKNKSDRFAPGCSCTRTLSAAVEMHRGQLLPRPLQPSNTVRAAQKAFHDQGFPIYHACFPLPARLQLYWYGLRVTFTIPTENRDTYIITRFQYPSCTNLTGFLAPSPLPLPPSIRPSLYISNASPKTQKQVQKKNRTHEYKA